MEDSIGVIVDYKYLIGANVGKIYRRRFENVASFAVWAKEYDNSRIVEIINTKVVDSKMVYWNDRWVAAKAN